MGLSEEAKKKAIDVLELKDEAVDEEILETAFEDCDDEAKDIPDDFLDTYRRAQYKNLQKKYEEEMEKAEKREKKYKEEKEEKEELKKVVKEKDEQIEELKKKVKQDNQSMNHLVVLGPSEAAKDRHAREQFRREVVSGELCYGGFVCHPMHVEFVKAARSMSSNQQEQNTGSVEQEKPKNIEKIAEELEKEFGRQLKERDEYPVFSKDYMDDESMQSAWFVKCLREALQRMGAPTALVMEHQWNVLAHWKDRYIKKDNQENSPQKPSPQKRNEGNPNKSAKLDNKGVKLNTKMDAFCFYAIEGTPPIAAFEYKPNNTDTPSREAQADMCASNVQAVLGKPCLSVDVAGGNLPNEWKINAYALAPRPQGWPGKSTHTWDKCPLYEGTGFTGLVRLAAGILATLPCLSERRDKFGSRMGPVVGVDGNRVFKGYDRATTRKPNIDLIREFVDNEAKLWTTSVEDTLEILEMKLLDNIWNDKSKMCNPVSVTVLISILTSLAQLHEKNLVHGDLRLTNVLSCGKIVDFDFAGKHGEKEYPKGLQELSGDGERHPDVSTWIQKRCCTDLVMKKEHDLHSMKEVMCLFKIHVPDSVDSAGSGDDMATLETVWSDSIKLVEDGEIKKAIEVLGEHKETMELVLKERIKNLLLVGTGATPKKKPRSRT